MVFPAAHVGQAQLLAHAAQSSNQLHQTPMWPAQPPLLLLLWQLVVLWQPIAMQQQGRQGQALLHSTVPHYQSAFQMTWVAWCCCATGLS
jgi:hypothetical protein